MVRHEGTEAEESFHNDKHNMMQRCILITLLLSWSIRLSQVQAGFELFRTPASP